MAKEKCSPMLEGSDLHVSAFASRHRTSAIDVRILFCGLGREWAFAGQIDTASLLPFAETVRWIGDRTEQVPKWFLSGCS